MIKRGSKKGQEILGMSIGTIFSIFIIAVIITVAVYVIVKVQGIGSCTNVGFFYEDLQDEINKAWTSGRYKAVYEGNLVSSGALRTEIEYVCFGNLTIRAVGDDRRRQQEFDRYSNSNVFMYPPEKACDGLESKKIEHVKIDDFFCVNVKENNGKIRVKIEKETRDNLVKLIEG